MRPLFSLQGPRRREGRQPRFPEDLVAVGVADPGQIPLRPQEALQLHPGLIEHRGEGFRGERRIQRLYAQAADRRGLLNLRRPPDVQTGALLWSQLHQPEILTAVELEDQRHVLCGALRRGGDRQPPVALGVDDHDQRAGEVEEGEFPPPPHVLDRRPLDGRDRRVDRLQQGDAAQVRGADRPPDDPRPQIGHQGLDEGNLRHRAAPPRPSGGPSRASAGPPPRQRAVPGGTRISPRRPRRTVPPPPPAAQAAAGVPPPPGPPPPAPPPPGPPPLPRPPPR